jgi:hypothetical protein
MYVLGRGMCVLPYLVFVFWLCVLLVCDYEKYIIFSDIAVTSELCQGQTHRQQESTKGGHPNAPNKQKCHYVLESPACGWTLYTHCKCVGEVAAGAGRTVRSNHTASATCAGHLILLDLIVLIWRGMKIRFSSLCNFLHNSVASSFSEYPQHLVLKHYSLVYFNLYVHRQQTER